MVEHINDILSESSDSVLEVAITVDMLEDEPEPLPNHQGEKCDWGTIIAKTPGLLQNIEEVWARLTLSKVKKQSINELSQRILIFLCLTLSGNTKKSFKGSRPLTEAVKNTIHLLNKISMPMPPRAVNHQSELEKQLLINLGVSSKKGQPVLYMRPAEYTPSRDDLDTLLRSLCYQMHVLSESKAVRKRVTKRFTAKGFLFLADMTGWTMSHFSINYAKSFFAVIQGKYPVMCSQFIIADPPSWFGKVDSPVMLQIWAIIKKFMTANFLAKVKILQRKEWQLTAKESR